MKNFKDFTVETKCIPDQPEGIHDEATEEITIPKILEVAKQFEKEGADVILVSCCADPGVEAVRRSLNIPVIGAGSACSFMALSLGNRIGTLGITKEAPWVMVKNLGEKFTLNIKPEGINTTMDLFSKESRGDILKAALLLKEKKCDTIALSCTGMSTIGAYKEIKQNTELQVIDPVLSAGAFILYLQVQKRSIMNH